MTTFATGRRAEAAAAEYLKINGYTIVQQNYRTRFCEIDIIAFKSGITHFVEVKYRKNNKRGGGLLSITNRKLNQMTVAAEYWLQDTPSEGGYFLSAIEVSGAEFKVTGFIESLT